MVAAPVTKVELSLDEAIELDTLLADDPELTDMTSPALLVADGEISLTTLAVRDDGLAALDVDRMAELEIVELE